MADLTETATWEEGIHRLELTDPVEGGEDGVSNRQAKQLANRTKHLRETGHDQLAVFADVAALEAAYPPAAGYRGKLALVASATGDDLYMCRRQADGETYAWGVVTLG